MRRALVGLRALVALQALVTIGTRTVQAQDLSYDSGDPAAFARHPSGQTVSAGPDDQGDTGRQGDTADQDDTGGQSTHGPDAEPAAQAAAEAATGSGGAEATGSQPTAAQAAPQTARPGAADGPPAASEPPAPPRWGSTRVLGGHSFLLGSFVPSGLINSRVGVRAGLEYHQVSGYVQLPSLGATSPQVVDLQTINIAETIDFAVRLHDHFAIYGDGYGKARVGANINTLLGAGADYTYGGHLGLLVKLFHLSSFQISVAGQAGYYAGQSAGIMALFQDLNVIAQDAVEEVQQNPVIDVNRAVDKLNTAFRTATADLLTPFEGLTYGVSLNIAQALGRYAGLQASVGYYAESATYRPTRYDSVTAGPVMQEHTVSTQRPSFGLAADFDASPAGLPLAIMLEYQATPTNVTDTQDSSALDLSSLEQLLALGLFYSGRTDLQLGVTTYSVYGRLPTLNADAATSDKPLDIAGQLVFRYFW